jgi:hypothetical protein
MYSSGWEIVVQKLLIPDCCRQVCSEFKENTWYETK